MNLHRNTVLYCLRRFRHRRLRWVIDHKKGGPPRRIPWRVVCPIRAMAQHDPADYGLDHGTWPLACRPWLVTHKRQLVKRFSRAYLRRILKKGGFGSGTSSARSTRTTPPRGHLENRRSMRKRPSMCGSAVGNLVCLRQTRVAEAKSPTQRAESPPSCPADSEAQQSDRRRTDRRYAPWPTHRGRFRHIHTDWPGDPTRRRATRRSVEQICAPHRDAPN